MKPCIYYVDEEIKNDEIITEEKYLLKKVHVSNIVYKYFVKPNVTGQKLLNRGLFCQ